MTMDAPFWVDLAWKILMLSLMVWAALKRSDAALTKKIEALEKDLEATNRRLVELSTELHARPNIGDIKDIYREMDKKVGELHEKINDVAHDLAAQSGTINGMKDLLTAIHRKMMKEPQ